MTRSAIAVDVLIASPGDVNAERDIVEQCILEWNAIHSRPTGIVLTPRRWERDATPDLSMAPQERINVDIVRKSDILIGVFWSRMGTRTSKARSGTEEEILEFIDAKRRCLLYFSEKPLPPDCDTKQITSLRLFKKEVSKRGLVATYRDNADLFKKVSAHLSRALQDEIIDKINNKTISIGGIHGSINLLRSRSSWRAAYEAHRGSYLMYTYLQTEVRSGRAKTSRDVCVSLVNIYELTEAGIAFELFNPQMRSNDYQLYTYRGIALPAEGRFLYFFADQLEANYEVFCAVTEFVNVKPPLYTVGHAIVVGVNPEIREFRTGSTGFLLKYKSAKRESPQGVMRKMLGFFSRADVDDEIVDRLPRIYYKQ
jgi:hypothetical protein